MEASKLNEPVLIIAPFAVCPPDDTVKLKASFVDVALGSILNPFIAVVVIFGRLSDP